MKANCRQTTVKLTASKIGSHIIIMVRIVTKYAKKFLHQVFPDCRILGDSFVSQ